MSTIHFLNVLEGDCNIIRHDSNRVTVIDVSNAYNDEDTQAETAVKNSKQRQEMFSRTMVPATKVDYRQKHEPDNPIEYLNKLGVASIFRFIVTHPDMDHLDGIRDLFAEFEITNTWDTDNNKEIESDSFGGGYNGEDWDFYKDLRDGKYKDTKRLTPFAGHSRDFWNDDNLTILCPTPELLEHANECGDYNDSSYAILFTPPKKNGGNWKILFAGDTHDDSWEYIIENYEEEVSNVDILFAPHHGRDSNRDYGFLETVNPKITLFGNASSAHLAYDNYPPTRITNNQAGYVVMNITENGIDLYVKNKEFADDFRNSPKRDWGDASYNNTYEGWHLCRINP